MPRIRRPWIVSFIALMLLAAAGVASADDTQLNVGYDEENHVLIVNRSATNSPYDCRLENGPLMVGYGVAEDGPIPVDSLEVEVEAGVFDAFEFLNREAEEVDTETFTPAEEPVEYAGSGGECGLTAGAVGGPNGQINHGQFMKLFHQLVDKQGFGCINRVLAQSDLGKGDQQLQTADVDPEFEMGESGTVLFETFIATCDHGKKDKGDDHPGKSQGKAANGDSPGKSGSAPGRNK